MRRPSLAHVRKKWAPLTNIWPDSRLLPTAPLPPQPLQYDFVCDLLRLQPTASNVNIMDALLAKYPGVITPLTTGQWAKVRVKAIKLAVKKGEQGGGAEQPLSSA